MCGRVACLLRTKLETVLVVVVDTD
eukprot:COSAG06_NODE_50676_length_317_cov_0.697248_2_plen_24_part_01